MISVVRKELREHLAAALLLGSTTSCIMALLIWQGLGEDRTAFRGFQAIAALCAAASALMLGFKQTWFEGRDRTWELLFHRPLSRFRVFAAKSSAGLALYTSAFVLPLAGAVAVTALAPYPAPYCIEYALPGFTDWFGGIAWYFAGMALGLRAARRHWWRLLLLIIPATASLGTFAFEVSLWQAFLAYALAIAWMAICAWGGFRALGDERIPSRAARVCAALAMCWAVIVAYGWLSTALHLVPSEARSYSRTEPNDQVFLKTDGGFAMVDWQGREFDFFGRTLAERKVDARHRHWAPEYEVTNAYSYGILPRATQLRNTGGLVDEQPRISDERGRSVGFWFYVHRSEEFQLFRPDGVRLATVGVRRVLSECRDQPAQTRWHDARLVVLPQGAFDFEPYTGSLRCLFAPEPSETLLAHGALQSNRSKKQDYSSKDEEPPGDRLVVTDRRVIVNLPNASNAIYTFRAPLRSVDAEVARHPDGRLLVWTIPQRAGISGHLIEFRGDGSIERDREIPGSVRGLAHAEYRADCLPKAGVLLPPALVGAITVLGTTSFQGDGSTSEIRRVSSDLTIRMLLVSAASVWFGVFGILLLMVWVGYTLREGISWLAVAVLTGPPAWLLFVCLDPYQHGQRCARCQRRFILTRAACTHCGAPIARPATDGTEIFDSCSPTLTTETTP